MTGCPRACLIHAIALAVVAARQSASSKMASCTPANAQDSNVEQCNPWCKADAEHKIHCTVRGRAQRISTPRCVSLLCVLLYGSSANARPVRSAEAQCRRRPDRRHHHLRRRSAPRRRTAIQTLPCVSHGVFVSSQPSIATTASAGAVDFAGRAFRRDRRRHRRHPRLRRHHRLHHRHLGRRPHLDTWPIEFHSTMAWPPR